MIAGARVDDGGKVPREIVRISAVYQWKDKGHLQCDLRGPDESAILPSLTVNRPLATGSNGI